MQRLCESLFHCIDTVARAVCINQRRKKRKKFQYLIHHSRHCLSNSCAGWERDSRHHQSLIVMNWICYSHGRADRAQSPQYRNGSHSHHMSHTTSEWRDLLPLPPLLLSQNLTPWTNTTPPNLRQGVTTSSRVQSVSLIQSCCCSSCSGKNTLISFIFSRV